MLRLSNTQDILNILTWQLQEQKSDTAGETIQIEWHVTLQCKYCASCKNSCRRPCTNLRDVQTTICTSIFNDITDYASDKVQGKCLVSAKAMSSLAARFRLGYWCFCDPGLEQTWKYHVSCCSRRMEQTRFRSDMRSDHQQTSRVQVFKHDSISYIDMKERETWTAHQKRAAKPSHAREYGFGIENRCCTKCQFSEVTRCGLRR